MCALVKLQLVVPASSAQAERSFSALQLKNNLRTTMTEMRLNSVAVFYIRHFIPDNIDSNQLMHKLVVRFGIKKSLFGKIIGTDSDS